MLNCTVRNATKNDAAQILGIVEKLSKDDKSFLAFNWKKDIIKQNIRQGKHIYVAEYNGKIVGFIRESGRPNNSSMLEDLFVLPEYRSRGVGSALISHIKTTFSTIQMKTKADNTRINNLAKKHEFKLITSSPKKTMYYWELTPSKGEKLSMFKDVLNDFLKLSEELNIEDLDKVAIKILAGLEGGLVKIADETPYQLENRTITEELDKSLSENYDYSTHIMSRFQHSSPITRFEYLDRDNAGSIYNQLEEGGAVKLKESMSDYGEKGEVAGRIGGALGTAGAAYLIPKAIKKFRKSADFTEKAFYEKLAEIDEDMQEVYDTARDELKQNSLEASNIYTSKNLIDRLHFVGNPSQPIDLFKKVVENNEISTNNASKLSYRDGLGDGAIQGAGGAGAAILGGAALRKLLKSRGR